MTEEYKSSCSLAKPAKILSIIGIICMIIGLVFWIIIIKNQPNINIWIKNVGNILSGASIITSTIGGIFDVISLIKIKYNLDEFSKQHLVFLVLSIVSTIVASIFTGIINK